ncbi:hypothetical protein BDF20DRAFT_833700 [Mycotypha africana]|uniref:uncharacterized protein n=1 Tax=Mycotypha africana TaxID=64632 RepID=UPI002301BD4F|nr:uncharacterized protein BDF20DRAFT_833700 [Mycotypha africana]KAI8984170.1 hypothetical protein BDF20DRAFT_833700 [Mycotypha africana]
MLSNLYPELLELVASHLPNHAQYNCLTVCQRWYQAMLRTLYKNIQINHRRQLKLLLKHLAEQPEKGRFIRQLHFKRNNHDSLYTTNQGIKTKIIGVTAEELEQLALYCTSLDVLDFDQNLWKYIKLPLSMLQRLKRLPAINVDSRTEDQWLWKTLSSINNKPLTGLTQLTLGGEIVSQMMSPARLDDKSQHYYRQQHQQPADISISTSPLIQCLKNVPELRKLCLNSKQPKSHVINVFIEDMEAIHQACLSLEELTLIGSFKFIPTFINNSKNNGTAISSQKYHRLRRLKLIASIPPTWFYYIGYKYPALEELDFDSIITPVVHEYQTLFKKLPSSSSRSTATIATNVIMYFRQRLIQHRLDLSDLEIQSLFCHLLDCCPRLRKIELDSASAKTYITEQFFQKCHASSSRHSCHKLKEIKIKTDTSYNLINQREFFDLLVNHGQNLITGLGTEVIFNGGTISLSQLSSFSKLTDLVICCGHPTVECEIDLILSHCQKLEQLTIRSAYVTLSDSKNDKQPHPLKSLQLSTVSFSPSVFEYLGIRCHNLSQLSIYECEQKTDDSSKNCINLSLPHNHFKSVILKGIRLDSVPLKNHNWTPNVRLVSIEQEKKDKRWYHAYDAHQFYPVQKDTTIQKLNERKRQIAEHYYQFGWINNQKYIEKIISTKYSHREPYYLYTRTSRDWEADLFFGYVAIQCQSIEHWELICNTAFNEF